MTGSSGRFTVGAASAALAVGALCLGLTRAGAETVPLSAPGILDREGATYVLTQDISAPGTALTIVARGITLDLNGYTVTYNTEPSDTPVYGITVGSPEVWLNMDERGLRIRNGSIVQGAGGSAHSHAVYMRYTSPRNVEISGLDIGIWGDDSKGVHINWGSQFHIHDNRITSNVSVCTNRHAYDSYAVWIGGAATGVSFHHNTIRGGHGGIAVTRGNDVAIYENDISHRCLAGNGYGVTLYAPRNTVVHSNRIVSEDGLGILVDNEYQNVEITGNYIDVRMVPKAEGIYAWGIKCRTYPEVANPYGLRVRANVITSTTGEGYLPWAAGIGIYDGHQHLGNEYSNNAITAISTDATKRAAGIIVAGAKAANTGTVVYGNRIVSNHVNVKLSSSDGEGADGIRFVSNTLVRAENPVDYATLGVGHWTCSTLDTVFLDTRTENGADIHDAMLVPRSGGGEYSYYVSWYLDVEVRNDAGHPVEGAAVVGTTASEGEGGERVVRMTDARGLARLELTEYYRHGMTWPATSEYEHRTPHVVTVHKDGYEPWSDRVVMDASKTIGVTLVPEEAAGEPDVSVQLSADRPVVAPGEVVTYTIEVRNTSTSTLGPVVVVDPIPEHCVYVPGSAKLDGVPISPDPYSAGQMTVVLDTVEPGQARRVTFQVVLR